MKKIRIAKSLTIITVLLGLVQCSAPQPNDIVAKVGDEGITAKDLAQAIYREEGKFGEKDLKEGKQFLELKKKVLDDLIRDKILVREANSFGIDISEEELEKELRNYKSRYTEKDFQAILEKRKIDYLSWREVKKAHLVIDRFLREKVFTSIKVPEEEMKSYYQEHREEFRQPESVHIRQILTDTKEKAERILKKLNNGENFAKLAHDLSLSPDRARGGDLGFIRRGTFPKEFDICFDLKPGELSPITSSLYGFHIFKVLEKRPESQISYEEARSQIEEWLKQEKREQAFEEYFRELKKKYPIEINQSVLKKVVI